MKQYVVDYVGVDGDVFCGDDGRTELMEEHPLKVDGQYGEPKERREPKKHYDHLPPNFRFMDRCNDRARDGWWLVNVAPKIGLLGLASNVSRTEGLWPFFERDV